MYFVFRVDKSLFLSSIHQFIFCHILKSNCRHIQGGPKKSKPPPIFQKIVLKIANEIRFLRKVKV